MKALYESILDDEDILINKANNCANNPFVKINRIANESYFLREDIKSQRKIRDIIMHELVDYLPEYVKNHLITNFYGENVAIKSSPPCTLEVYEDFIIIRSNVFQHSLGSNRDDSTAVLFLDPIGSEGRKYLKCYGFSNKRLYDKWINDIVKKFDLNKTRDKYIYTV